MYNDDCPENGIICRLDMSDMECVFEKCTLVLVQFLIQKAPTTSRVPLVVSVQSESQ